MNKTKAVKTVVSYMTGYSVGAATAVFLNTFRKHSDNAAVEIAIDGATFVTGLAVGELAHDKIRTHTDARIDEISAWLQANLKK